MQKYDVLKLSNQLCFPLYACANEVLKLYKPVLDELGLTYTQYIVMLALWERSGMSEKELGAILHLDSGTLAPVLKRMCAKGLVQKTRSEKDERHVVLSVTEEGEALKERAVNVPMKVGSCIGLSKEDAEALFVLINKLLASFPEKEKRGKKN